MTDAPDAPRLAETFDEVEDALLSRWPETKLEPSLDRIEAFTELLGEPQHSFRSIHLTGTNGKTSTSRMIETLLRALDLRTGRFTSPHLERMSERISIDGEPLDDEAFVRAFNDVAPYTHLVDAEQDHPLSFFETIVGMAYAAFADAPVDVAVVEVGMGGSWDATNVIDADVAVVLPIAVDHAKYLGDDAVTIAAEKAGIIKPGSFVVLAEQTPEVAAVLLASAPPRSAPPSPARAWSSASCRAHARRRRAGDLAAGPARRATTTCSCRSTAPTRPRTPPWRWPPSRRSARDGVLDDDLVRAAFAEVTSPGRLEIIRRSPTILLDAAHNPHGAEAAAAALEDSFSFSPLVGVMGVMEDKDHEGLLAAFEPYLEHLVCTQNSTPRSMSAAALGRAAVEVFGEDRVSVVPDLADAIDRAATLAEAGEAITVSIGAGAVLVTGSVVTVGEARSLLKGRR